MREGAPQQPNNKQSLSSGLSTLLNIFLEGREQHRTNLHLDEACLIFYNVNQAIVRDKRIRVTVNIFFQFQMFMPPDPPKRPLEEIMEGDRLMPSAPSQDDPIQIPEHIAYMRSISAIEHGHDMAMPLEPCNGDFTHIHCGPHNHVRPAHPQHQHPQPTSHIPFMRHPHSYPGSINRQDSAISSVSAPARTSHVGGGIGGGGGCGGAGHVGNVGHRGSDAGSAVSGGGGGEGSTGGNEGTTGNRNTQCPNCSAKPPTYSESFHHPVMEHQLSHSSNHGESPPYSPPSSPDHS